MPIATDLFNRANGGLGSNWGNVDTDGGWGQPNISGNAVIGQSGWSNGASAARYTATSFGATQYSQAVIGGLGQFGAANGAGVIVRASADQDTAKDYYGVRVLDNAATNRTVNLGKFVNGTWTQLATTTTAVVNGDTVRLEADGTSLRVYVNGTQITALNATDSSLSSGQPGIVVTDAVNIDTWEGGDLVNVPVITGPTGAAGAASITHSVNENQNSAGTWTATNSGTWSLSGTDAALLSISSGGVVTLATGNFNFEAKSSYSFNVVNTLGVEVATQAVTLNINNANEAPTLSAPTFVVTGSTTATAGFTSTDSTRGTNYYRRRTGATPADAATVVSEGESQATGANPQTRAMTGFTAAVAVYVDMVQVIDGDSSNVVSFGPIMPGDTTAPTLTGAVTATVVGDTNITWDWDDATDNFQVSDYEVALSLNGGAYSVVASPAVSTLASTGLTPGGSYIARVRARDPAGNLSAAIFSTATVPGTAPSVLTQPASQSVSSGANVTFSSTGAGLPTPVGQWEHLVGASWTALAGQTATSLLLNGVTTADNGRQFRRTYTNAKGSVSSAVATLTVAAASVPPSFTTQPVSQSVPQAGTMSLTVAATGIPSPTLQWQRFNGTTWDDIAGATSATYALADVQPSDNGAQFRCRATNGASPDAFSSTAVLTVTTAGAGTYSALTDVIKINGIPLANTPVFYTWFPGGRAGAVNASVNKTGTTNGQGRLTVTHTVAGTGKVWLATRPGSTAAEDLEYLESLNLV